MAQSCNGRTENNCTALSMNTQNVIQVGIFIFFLASAAIHRVRAIKVEEALHNCIQRGKR